MRPAREPGTRLETCPPNPLERLAEEPARRDEVQAGIELGLDPRLLLGVAPQGLEAAQRLHTVLP